ncbi:hypothetical protein THII_3392 [Thioploca ingrica]|uniref:NHL repeat containing protein n=1 Tax=Thioploca ingrica TaxID=40754 RepID=A0A090AJN3_9GAMM|nr:hypothetical protein THII_3392 [Thioploca ingrica]
MISVRFLFLLLSFCVWTSLVQAEDIISTVAGTGTAGYDGEGVATSKMLNRPAGVAVDSAGNLYIADFRNHRIRKVDSTGNMTTVTGTGTAGYDGEGIATSKMLYYPRSVAVDRAGNLYIADHSNHRIRKVDSTGNITTVAGTGTAGYDGEGIATSKMLYLPGDIAVDNFEFRGAVIVGGVLAGQIINTSQVGGYFRDVQLAAGTHLIGGQLGGEISGDAQAPALLEDLEIEAGSYLQYVTIGEGVKLAAEVILGKGVQFSHPSDDPRLGFK